MGTSLTSAPRILVPIDGSELAEQAIGFAVTLAGPDGRLVFVRVVPHAETIRSIWGGVVASESLVEELAADDAARDLERARSLVTTGIDVDAETVAGDPADQIIQSALRHGAEMIVMASHGRGAVGRWTFGSVADRVARQSLVPVMIVCPSVTDVASGKIERLVVPLDGSPLAAHALPFAITIARQIGAPMHLVEVINPVASLYPTAAMSGPVADELYEEAMDVQQETASSTLTSSAATARDSGIVVSTQIEAGPTVPGIEAVLQPGDVIIITSHGRSGLRRWLLGSVAEKLIRNGKAPVILVPSAERQTVAERVEAPGLAFAPVSN